MRSKGALVLARLQDAVYDWIKNEMEGLIDPQSIVWRQQSEPLPPRPCVTLKFTSGPKQVGFQDEMTPVAGAPGKFNLGGQREMMMSLQVFGSSKVSNPMALQAAIDLHTSLSKRTVQEGLSRGGLALQGRTEPTNISALEETEFEDRAQFDVKWGVAQNVQDDIGVIEHVNINGTVSGEPVGPIPVNGT